jgi:hypothetical protein
MFALELLGPCLELADDDGKGSSSEMKGEQRVYVSVTLQWMLLVDQVFSFRGSPLLAWQPMALLEAFIFSMSLCCKSFSLLLCASFFLLCEKGCIVERLIVCAEVSLLVPLPSRPMSLLAFTFTFALSDNALSNHLSE